MELTPLILNKGEERRLRAGHLWVYSNEVDVKRTPLTGFTPGQQVIVQQSNGKPLGVAYINPHSLICARLVSRDPAHKLDRSLLIHRVNVALSLRQRVYEKPFYRLVHGEGDELPGLVVDRFGDVLVAQLNTAGMDLLRDEVLAALDKVIKPRAILLRNDSAMRELEGLQPTVEDGLGETPETVEIEENGARFLVPLRDGQKTGWFYDHRENRARMQRYARSRRVLDVFSYLGGWGVAAAVAGASEFHCVDSSSSALDYLARSAALNGVQERLTAIEGDAFEALKVLRAERERFDLVILDPPAFIKRKKDMNKGAEAYRRLNLMAMQVLTRDGILVSASCSHHLPAVKLRELMLKSARHLERNLQIIEQGHQAPDHPIHPAIAETEYIKCLTGRVTPA